ncbi:MAG: type II toxin-antitoxin system HicB family antitoxin [Candidatus Diapherotrites archaeon]
MDFDVVLEKQEEGGYTAYVPALPGCISEGETRADAMKNIKEAISIYIEETRKAKLERLLKNISIIRTSVKAYA